jgi:hypothetical protein
MIANNQSKLIGYFNSLTGNFCHRSDFLTADAVSKSSLAAHLHNSKTVSYDLQSYRPIISGIYPIPPRSTWDLSKTPIRRVDWCTLRNRTTTLELLDRRIKRLVFLTGLKSVAVELSGGLDSALAIASLHRLGVKTTLIGSRWNRFEFRTERRIQELLSEMYGSDTYLDDDFPYPFSDLMDIPLHALPDELSLTYARHRRNINLCKRLNLNFIIGGHGGDGLLCNPLQKLPNAGILFEPLQWEPYWAHENLYAPASCHLFSAYSFRSISAAICSLRIASSSGFNEDRFKLWARSFFRERLPIELSEFHYKASFGGVFLEGLERSLDSIKEILDFSSAHHPELRAMRAVFDRDLSRYSEMTSEENKIFFGLISFACWVYAYFKKPLSRKSEEECQ